MIREGKRCKGGLNPPVSMPRPDVKPAASRPQLKKRIITKSWSDMQEHDSVEDHQAFSDLSVGQIMSVFGVMDEYCSGKYTISIKDVGGGDISVVVEDR